MASFTATTLALTIDIPAQFSNDLNLTLPPLPPNPVGVSIEFFAWPTYFTLPGTFGCMGQLASLIDAGSGDSNVWPSLRIGGTTQDRALFDPTLAEAVNYTVASPADAPESLTYGPAFFELAAQWPGNVTLGLNRELDNLSNTIDAISTSLEKMPRNFYAVELGNEPDLYASTAPITHNQSWTPDTDAESQVQWQNAIATALDLNASFVQAGVRLDPSTGWSIPQLIPYEIRSGAISHVRTLAEHAYPQSACSGSTTDLPSLQSHSSIVEYTLSFLYEIQASLQAGKPHLFGETNSATCGGGGISSTFGAALWIVDFVLQAVRLGSHGLRFHMGTVGNCAYCWWGTNLTYAPFYGAYFVTEALADGVQYAQMLDNGTGDVGIYALWKDTDTVSKIVVYNSEYFDGSGTRTSQNVTFQGSFAENSLKVLRLTAPSATSKVENGSNPDIGGMMFSNTTCASIGEEQYESVSVVQGQQGQGAVGVEVMASEAVLVYL